MATDVVRRCVTCDAEVLGGAARKFCSPKCSALAKIKRLRSGCWAWTAAPGPGRAPQFGGRWNGRTDHFRGYRALYELLTGEEPPRGNFTVGAGCDPRCVHPDHLTPLATPGTSCVYEGCTMPRTRRPNGVTRTLLCQGHTKQRGRGQALRPLHATQCPAGALPLPGTTTRAVLDRLLAAEDPVPLRDRDSAYANNLRNRGFAIRTSRGWRASAKARRLAETA